MTDTRADRLAQNFAGQMDAVVVMNAGEPFLDTMFWYLTGATSGTFEGARAVVTADGELHTFVSILEEETARSASGIVHVYNTDAERKEQMKEVLSGCGRVGVNFSSTAYGSVEWMKPILKEGAEIVDASKVMSETIAVKDDREIALIEKACAISSSVANSLPDMLEEGVTEMDVASEMHVRMLRLGATGLAFDTIAAFGAHSSEPHYSPADTVLKKGDTALFDFGAKYKGYCSDLTRTIFFGEPEPILKRAYEVVRQAQLAGIAEMRDGADASAPDLAARKVIEESEFKGRFIHSFGHGIGMNIHEPIYVSPKSQQKLRAGNVVSAEPGVYIPGIGGIRIEDTVLITEDGCRVLTDYDHGFTVV
ncbi:MAG: Xaa-Pro peptidase family protein [Candidatus Methanomethylophilaceae archaeon]|nr:Xaa-Pro peptidase family protein [Candidatus Methanomethylophilaceae archaeon]MDY5872184.1 Xaa-Pro peptidase family protein [Candidatus Methanomethylophilaceae archaeon]